jgi:hypothetical protein
MSQLPDVSTSKFLISDTSTSDISTYDVLSPDGSITDGYKSYTRMQNIAPHYPIHETRWLAQSWEVR